jgi:excisionase family DNA binding protein
VVSSEHELLSAAEAALELRISRPSVRRLIDHGVLPIVQFAAGHMVRIKRERIDRLLHGKAAGDGVSGPRAHYR